MKFTFLFIFNTHKSFLSLMNPWLFMQHYPQKKTGHFSPDGPPLRVEREQKCFDFVRTVQNLCIVRCNENFNPEAASWVFRFLFTIINESKNEAEINYLVLKRVTSREHLTLKRRVWRPRSDINGSLRAKGLFKIHKTTK